MKWVGLSFLSQVKRQFVLVVQEFLGFAGSLFVWFQARNEALAERDALKARRAPMRRSLSHFWCPKACKQKTHN